MFLYRFRQHQVAVRAVFAQCAVLAHDSLAVSAVEVQRLAVVLRTNQHRRFRQKVPVVRLRQRQIAQRHDVVMVVGRVLAHAFRAQQLVAVRALRQRVPVLAARAHAWFLDDIHESDHEEVILQRTDSRLRQYRLLPTDGTSDGDAVWWDVILEATLTERVETREDLGRGVALETDAAAQEVVVVLLPHSGRGAVGHTVVVAVETAAGRYGDLKRKQIQGQKLCIIFLHNLWST